MSEEDVLKEGIKNLSNRKFDLDSVYWVHVTHIINPSNFYVRLSSDGCLLKQFDNITEDMLKKPNSAEVGDIVFYKSMNRRNKMRGIIRKFDDEKNTYDVSAMDYGFYDKDITSENLWLCNFIFPPLAYLCKLYQCRPITEDGSWLEDSIESMMTFVGNTIVKMIYKGKTMQGKLIVQINNCPCDVGSMLILSECATLDYIPSSVNKLTSTVLEQS